MRALLGQFRGLEILFFCETSFCAKIKKIFSAIGEILPVHYTKGGQPGYYPPLPQRA